MSVGEPAVPLLIQLLSHRKPHVRWEAAKAVRASPTQSPRLPW